MVDILLVIGYLLIGCITLSVQIVINNLTSDEKNVVIPEIIIVWPIFWLIFGTIGIGGILVYLSFQISNTICKLIRKINYINEKLKTGN